MTAASSRNAAECDSCYTEPGNPPSCPDSLRQCGHHCNHSWSHDACCWCGETWGEVDARCPTETTRSSGGDSA